MTAVRTAAFAGLLCSIAVSVWVAGGIVLTERWENFDRQEFSLGLKSLWIGQAFAIAALVPWYSSRSGWRNAALGQLVFIAVPLPLLALSWLVGAAEMTTLSFGVLFLLVESLLVLGAAMVAGRFLLASLPSAIGVATVQVVSVSVIIALLGLRPDWISP